MSTPRLLTFSTHAEDTRKNSTTMTTTVRGEPTMRTYVWAVSQIGQSA